MIFDPFAPLRRVLVRRPGADLGTADPEAWGYGGRIDIERARAQHKSLVEALVGAGAEVVLHDLPQPGKADAVFVFDPVLIAGEGFVTLSMGKELRRGEEAALQRRLLDLGLHHLGRLEGGARAEGGDLLWLDESRLACGLGFRTNRAGVEALERLLAPLGIAVEAFDLPFSGGPERCLHLQSLISRPARDLAVIHLPLLPVRLWRHLERRGIRRVEVPAEELPTLGPNVLGLGDGRVIVVEGNPRTRAGLEAAGCEVIAVEAPDLCLLAEGGPTCLTLPLERSAEALGHPGSGVANPE